MACSKPTRNYDEFPQSTYAARRADIAAYAYLRGRPRPTNDSWIAACCLAYDLPLATQNVKDFQDFAAARRSAHPRQLG
jgi:predicted nucleic acid-binding protein